MKFLIVIVTVCVFGACNAEEIDADRSKWTPLKCDAGLLSPNDDRMKEIGDCAATHGPEPGKKNPNCTYLCQGVALGVLNKKGVPTQENYDGWVQQSFPEEHKIIATAWFRDCFQKYGQFIDLEDQDCKMAKLFGDCTWKLKPQLTCTK